MNSKSIAAILLAGGGFLASCGNKQAGTQMPGPKVVQVTKDVVTEELVTGTDNYPGSVVPLKQTELRAEVNGYITSILVADGASVSQGQALYEIDKTRYAAALDQAKAALEIAQANYAKVGKDLQRYQKLAEQDAIAKQTLDYAGTDLNNAQAQVNSAKAALVTAQTNLDRSVIRAPFAGTIGISQVRMGALVSAGTTLINTISSVNPIAVDLPVNQDDIQRFVELQKSKSTLTDSIITLQLGSQMYTHPGSISTIDRAVDPNTGTITVRVVFPNPEGLLRAGMNANVRVLNKQPQKQLVIPYKAVVEQLGEYNVYTVSDSSTAVQKRVKLGITDADKIVIEDGLKLGDTIITDGIINLTNGVKVTDQAPQPAAAPTKK
ncbi:membrane fusion protein, multidrug efflux system [bacterium A37T11]|nr:membrane fusion protein, multidrug efflux system [bacterium A37T11]